MASEKSTEAEEHEDAVTNTGSCWRWWKEHVTVEPMLACYIMPSVLAALATQNLNLEKACRVNLRYDEDVCDRLSARNVTVGDVTAKAEHQVQQLVAHMAVWKTVVQSSLPCLLILFLGSWSDRWRRRKPCMLLPIVGEFVTSIGLIACTFWFWELPMEAVGVTEALFPALTGGWFTMFMATFSYVGDITTVERRTLRIGVVNVFVSLGVPVGMALSGVLYTSIGFYGVFSVSAVLYVASFAYGLLCIRDVGPAPPVNGVKAAVEKTRPPTRPLAFLRDFFDLKHVADTFRVAFKSGERNRRARVVVLMLVVMVVIGPLHGE